MGDTTLIALASISVLGLASLPSSAATFDQARQFLANRNKNRADQTAHVIYLSPIFKWYAGDFEKSAGSVLKFIKPFWPDSERAELEKAGSDNFQIEYTDYDWSLNALGK